MAGCLVYAAHVLTGGGYCSTSRCHRIAGGCRPWAPGASDDSWRHAGRANGGAGGMQPRVERGGD